MILAQIKSLDRAERRRKRSEAEEIAEPLIAYLQGIEGVKRVTVAGSYRRCMETVGDLDILVTARRGSPVVERFAAYDEVAQVIARGTTRSTVQLRCGMQVDLRVVPEVSYGAALHYFTGSKAHNIAVRTIGARRGLKINEYGVFRGARRVAGRTEAEVFDAAHLPYIPPELRENRGEIEAAQQGALPDLLELPDIRGDLHCHTVATDGRDELATMVGAAIERGYDYLAVSDHSKHVTVAHGLDAARLAEQIDAIDRLNDAQGDIAILKSCEVDILENGSLDLPDALLRRLDLTVCAVHYKFNLSRQKQTDRILKAMDNRNFNILAHPTGRLINERAPYEIDLDQIMEAAAEKGCILELNAHPDRLDLTDQACRMAKEIGVKIAISTDAHSADTLAFMRFGVQQARRGWLGRDDVVNTRSLAGLRPLLER
jgi:DNA polymerase (family 10)